MKILEPVSSTQIAGNYVEDSRVNDRGKWLHIELACGIGFDLQCAHEAWARTQGTHTVIRICTYSNLLFRSYLS